MDGALDVLRFERLRAGRGLREHEVRCLRHERLVDVPAVGFEPQQPLEVGSGLWWIEGLDS